MTALASTAPRDEAEPRPSFRGIAWTALRVAVSVGALVTLYYVLPLDHASTPVAVTILFIGLAGFIVLVVYQVWLIIRSPSRGCGPSSRWPRASRSSCCCLPPPMSCWPSCRRATSAGI
jgi:hypothetical protein